MAKPPTKPRFFFGGRLGNIPRTCAMPLKSHTYYKLVMIDWINCGLQALFDSQIILPKIGETKECHIAFYIQSVRLPCLSITPNFLLYVKAFPSPSPQTESCHSGNSISSFILTKPYFSYNGRPIAVASKEIEVIPLHLASQISLSSVLYAMPFLL